MVLNCPCPFRYFSFHGWEPPCGNQRPAYGIWEITGTLQDQISETYFSVVSNVLKQHVQTLLLSTCTDTHVSRAFVRA